MILPHGAGQLSRRCSGSTPTVDARTIITARALLLARSSLTPVVAQPVGVPMDCTEAKFSTSTFTGHDCGEWASVVIAGNIVIRKPWSRAIRASRAVRIRERRDGQPDVAADPARTPRPEWPPEADCHPAYGGCLPIVEDLDCLEIDDLQVQVFDPRENPYGLDVSRGVGHGIACDDES
jgi:hypothetical protein